MLCRQVMEIYFLVVEKSWKIIVEKEWSPWSYDSQHHSSLYSQLNAFDRVSTHLENLEKSGNYKVVREKSGKMKKVRSLTSVSWQKVIRRHYLATLEYKKTFWRLRLRPRTRSDTLAGGEGAGCPLLKKPTPTVDHSVKHVDESARLEKSHVVWKVATLSGNVTCNIN